MFDNHLSVYHGDETQMHENENKIDLSNIAIY